MKLDCSACKSEKTMNPEKVKKFNGIVVFIGYLIAIPSVLGVIISFIIMMGTCSAGIEIGSQAVTDAEMAGAALGTGLGVGFGVIAGISSLMGGLLGWLLIHKKKVYKCTQCGFIINRD